MVVLGWVIIGLFAAGYIFGPPFLFGGGHAYLKALGSWIGFLVVAAVLLFVLLFAVGAVSGA